MIDHSADGWNVGLEAVRRSLVAHVRQALGGAARVALVNFPDIGNLGDSAIWLGTMGVLAEIGVAVVYHSRPQDLSTTELRRAEPQAVLINGGGNLGDLWQGQHQTREVVLQELGDLPIVQLSQSMWFQKSANREEFARIAAGPRRLKMLWRDQRSYDDAMTYIAGDHSLSHDMAFGLAPASRIGEPQAQVIAVLRTDKERRIRPVDFASANVAIVDWESARPTADDRIAAASRAAAGLHIDPIANVERIESLYINLARWRVRRAIEILSRGRVVVTDRLHAHLLAGVAGIPSVAMDNSYGKVSGVHRRSLAGIASLRMAEDFDAAVRVAQTMVAM